MIRALFLVAIACAACAPPPRYSWDVGDRSAQEVARDRFECERDAMTAAPAAIIHSPPPVDNSRTECRVTAYDSVVCQSQPRIYADPFGAMQNGQDANMQNRNRLFALCMVGRGYRVVKQQ